ncbi:MAG: hypothetical protein GXY53_00505 [Desulfobulbus sp.]|nr:hypothetical protein [Desulfobulbus sp.]
MPKLMRWRWGAAVLALLLLYGCGYYFPYAYDGEHRVIYMPAWSNRTNKLGLDMKIYQSLAHWFQKSSSITLTREKSRADFILDGEILAVELPSVSWDSISEVTGSKLNLFVRWVLKDQKSGTVLWEVPKKLYTEDYRMATSVMATEDDALKKIIEDMSEDIYLGALKRIRKQARL